jgi:hypothetical protein
MPLAAQELACGRLERAAAAALFPHATGQIFVGGPEVAAGRANKASFGRRAHRPAAQGERRHAIAHVANPDGQAEGLKVAGGRPWRLGSSY